MGKRIVIALGGNALGSNLPEQMKAVKITARAIVDLIEDGNEVVICHGNGPQVGMIQNAMAELTRSDPEKYIPCPLSVCVAMSQGYIGYDLQNAMREEMLDRGITKGAATVLTQVEVDPEDPAFLHPTKPIGPFMTEKEARALEKEREGMAPGGGQPRAQSDCGDRYHPRPGGFGPYRRGLRRRRNPGFPDGRESSERRRGGDRQGLRGSRAGKAAGR